MTLNCGDPFDAIAFGISRAKLLGLSKRQLSTKAVLVGFGVSQGVLITRDRPVHKTPFYWVFHPGENAAKAFAFILSSKP
jgi:hypothetical protein